MQSLIAAADWTEQAQAGLWQALIAINPKRLQTATHAFAAGSASARYSLSIHAFSNLRMRASLTWAMNRARRSTSTPRSPNMPSHCHRQRRSARKWCVRTKRSRSSPSHRRGPGAYEASVPTVQAGVYRFCIIAQGSTMRGRPFTREQTRTGAVWRGGDQPPRPPNDPGRRFCELLHCLLKQKGVLDLLSKNGIDPAQIARCLDRACRYGDRGSDPTLQLIKDERALSIIADALRQLDVAHE